MSEMYVEFTLRLPNATAAAAAAGVIREHWVVDPNDGPDISGRHVAVAGYCHPPDGDGARLASTLAALGAFGTIWMSDELRAPVARWDFDDGVAVHAVARVAVEYVNAKRSTAEAYPVPIVT
jgi:hypothetical protein